MATANKSVRGEYFHFLFLSPGRSTFMSSGLRKHTDFVGHSALNSRFKNTRLLPFLQIKELFVPSQVLRHMHSKSDI